jgi:hypothetical protein
MGSGTKGVPLLALACLLIVSTAPVLAQTTAGRILGTVRRATRRTVTAGELGGYVIPILTPSVSVVRDEANGFNAVERLNVPLEVATDTED